MSESEQEPVATVSPVQSHALTTYTVSAEERLTFGELAEEIVALRALVEMDEGEWTDTHEELYAAHAVKLAEKSDSYAPYRAMAKQKAERLKAVAESYSDLAKRWENHVASLDSYVIHAMDTMERTESVGERWRVAVQYAGNPAVVITDETVVPEMLEPELTRVIPEKTEIDMKAVREVLEQEREKKVARKDSEVPWAHLAWSRYLRVYPVAPRPKAPKDTKKTDKPIKAPKTTKALAAPTEEIPTDA